MTGRRRFVLRRNGTSEELTVEGVNAGAYRITRGKTVETVEARILPDGRLSVLFEDGRQVSGRGTPRGNGLEVSGPRGTSWIQLADPLRDRLAATKSAGAGEGRHEEVRTLMPGRVVQVCVRPGERVEEGALLLVLEAMKMQNEIRAPWAGGVEAVSVSDGQSVEAGALLLSIRN